MEPGTGKAKRNQEILSGAKVSAHGRGNQKTCVGKNKMSMLFRLFILWASAKGGEFGDVLARIRMEDMLVRSMKAKRILVCLAVLVPGILFQFRFQPFEDF
jgi:hypothetical protein